MCLALHVPDLPESSHQVHTVGITVIATVQMRLM